MSTINIVSNSKIDGSGGTVDGVGKTIDPGLRADLMRKVMETKNTLTHKGSIYVGTGNKETVSVGSDSVEIYETKELTIGNRGQVLMADENGNLVYGYAGTGIQNNNELNLVSRFTDSSGIVNINIRDGITGNALNPVVNAFRFCTGDGYNTHYADITCNDIGCGQIYCEGVATGSGAISGGSISINNGNFTVTDAGAVTAAGTFSGVSGNFTGNVEAQTFNARSDKRLKENIKPFSIEKSILGLPVYKYDFIGGESGQIGCLAQDLQEICPELVHENKDGYLVIQESKIVYLLLNEVRKLRKEVELLKSERR